MVAKREPLEKVGNVVEVDGRLRIIEYSDLPDAIARRRNARRSLAIWAGSIGVHAIERSFLQRVANRGDGLPFHRAAKKVPYINAAGERIEPLKPNAVKFERFIFDLLPWADNGDGDRGRCRTKFRPAEKCPRRKERHRSVGAGADGGAYRQWLREAGATVAEGVLVEINPLLAIDAQELARKIRPGTHVAQSTYFH